MQDLYHQPLERGSEVPNKGVCQGFVELNMGGGGLKGRSVAGVAAIVDSLGFRV